VGWRQYSERPRDHGADHRAFLEGKQEKSAREGFPYWNGETLYGVKWQNSKLVMYEQKVLTDPALKLPNPRSVN
jgi:arylsulfatase